ncbi:MAG TPA: alpha/beta hydrolase-fold protein [Gemmatimonadales bacterium]|nr:alpha/beta hydrolase-fold protein [Gemmatimonadales bacterium]
MEHQKIDLLDASWRIPDGVRDGAPVIALLHGRGSDREDMAELTGWLPSEAVLAFPNAPFPAAPWGYGPGWAWYRFLGGARPEPASLSRGQRALSEWIDALPAALPVRPGPLILGGFSQGGTSALAWALRHPGRALGVLCLSGFVPEHPGVPVTAESCRGLRVFWGHGTLDGSVPFSLAVAGRRALAAAGARVEARDYPAGHTITTEELSDLTGWLDDLLGLQ